MNLHYKGKLKKIAEAIDCRECKASLANGKVKKISHTSSHVHAYVICPHCKHENMLEMAKGKAAGS